MDIYERLLPIALKKASGQVVLNMFSLWHVCCSIV